MRNHPDYHVLDENDEVFLSASGVRTSAMVQNSTPKKVAEFDAGVLNEECGRVAFRAVPSKPNFPRVASKVNDPMSATC